MFQKGIYNIIFFHKSIDYKYKIINIYFITQKTNIKQLQIHKLCKY